MKCFAQSAQTDFPGSVWRGLEDTEGIIHQSAEPKLKPKWIPGSPPVADASVGSPDPTQVAMELPKHS